MTKKIFTKEDFDNQPYRAYYHDTKVNVLGKETKRIYAMIHVDNPNVPIFDGLSDYDTFVYLAKNEEKLRQVLSKALKRRLINKEMMEFSNILIANAMPIKC